MVLDGRMIGAASARVMTDGGPVDTGTWQPGDTTEAKRILGTLGVPGEAGTLPADAAVTAEQVAQGILTALGRVLVDAVRGGVKAAEAGRALVAALTDKAKCAAGALDEIVKAIGCAVIDWYRRRRVTWVQWVTDPASNVCGPCLENEAAGPVRFGQPFPSGDTNSPAHPNCRCATFPSAGP